MKSASGGLIAFLNSGQEFQRADLYTITLSGGTIFRFTSWDATLTLNSNVFIAGSLLFKRSKVKASIGMQVDDLQVDIFAGPGDSLIAVPFLQAAASGQLDQATVKLEYVLMKTAGDVSLGTVVQFIGTVSDVQVGRTKCSITVKSQLELLNVKMPRTLFQPACWHTLYDTGCTLNRNTFKVSTTASSGSTTSTINSSGLAQATGYFDLGSIKFTSGVNSGLSRSVKSYTVGVVNVMPPFPTAPANGDAFDIFPGCDKLQTTCLNKFNNLLNFGGQPYVPAPENAL